MSNNLPNPENLEYNILDKTSLQTVNNNIKEFSLNGNKFICKLVDIYDADTCKVVFILNNKFTKFTCRLKDIDTPEMRPPKDKPDRDKEKIAAKKARNRLFQLATNVDLDIDKLYKRKEIRELLEKNTKLIEINCNRFDKYGRVLGYLSDVDNNVTFNDILVNEKYAQKYCGKKKLPFEF